MFSDSQSRHQYFWYGSVPLITVFVCDAFVLSLVHGLSSKTAKTESPYTLPLAISSQELANHQAQPHAQKSEMELDDVMDVVGGLR